MSTHTLVAIIACPAGWQVRLLADGKVCTVATHRAQYQARQHARQIADGLGCQVIER